MSTNDHPDIFAGSCEGPGTAVPLAQPAPPFDPWGIEETAATRVMRQMAAGQKQAARAATESDRRDAATREALSAAGDGGESYSHSSKPANAPVEPTPLEESAQERADEIAELIAENARLSAERAAHWETVERQDADFHAHRFGVRFTILGANQDGEAIEEEYSPAGWDLSDDAAENARLREGLEAEVSAVIAIWLSHYRSLGLVRADLASFGEGGDLGDDATGPTFYLVHRAAEADLPVVELAQFPEVRVDLASIPGATLTLSLYTGPVNATMLHETMLRGGGGTGQWGGEATPQMDPAPDESRGEWLERVCLSRPVLGRLVAAWRRSGGNLDLFKAVGAASGQVARERPIEWIVPGLIPRGYVSLLVGTKQAGKSTLLGEMLAVVDSECQSPRHLLGTEITARGAGALVSGEDGVDFVAARNAYYEPVHGPAEGFVFVTAERPWAEVLKLLHDIPKSEVDIIGIDGLRAVMPGDEDSSGAISQFFDELNALAQHHNCAIVLIHHLSKGKVRSLSGMLQAVRGSGAITDRVRVAVGMIDRGSSVTEVGIIKHNIPPSETLWGEVNQGRLFRRHAASLTLVPIGQAGPDSETTSGEASSDVVADAIRHFNAIGTTLRQTGKRELFAQRFPKLAGFSRNAIRDAVASLIEAGRVFDEPDGLRIAVAE